MEQRRDVEFVPDDAATEQGEDVLELGLRRRIPRWVLLVAASLAAALVVAVAVSRHDSGHPAAVVSRSSSPSSSSSLLPQSAVGSRLPLSSTAPAVDVAMSGRTTWVLQPGRITALDDLTSRRAVGSFTADLSGPNSTPVLLVDPSFGTLWLVIQGSSPGRVLEFNAFTLSQRSASTLDTINSAAALNGHLYLTTGAHLIDIAPGSAPRNLATGRASGLFAVIADPTQRARPRLLILDLGFPSHVWTYRPGGKLTKTSAPLPFGKGSIAVAGGQIWVGGFGQTGAVLMHLAAGASAPNDLTAVGVSPLTGGLGPGALIVGSGQHVFWVRSGAGGDDLWCVDADTGRVDQHWNLSGAVASTSGTAVIATNTGAAPLHLAGCAG